LTFLMQRERTLTSSPFADGQYLHPFCEAFA
jgi:hypothetical protein